MASRYLYFSYDELVGLSKAYDKKNPAYCSPESYGVTAEECESYLKNLIKGERWSRRFISSFCYLGNLIIIAATIGFFLTFVKLFPISLLIGILIVVTLFGWMWINIGWRINPPFILIRPFYPSTNKNMERLFDDFLKKKDILSNESSHSKAELLDVICQSHLEVAACCNAVREELSNPSGDFIIGDLRFGMTREELHQSAVGRGLETLLSLNSPTSQNTYYLQLFLSAFWNINNGLIRFEMEDDCLSDLRIIGSNHPRPSYSPWDEDFSYEDMEDYPEYDECYKRLTEIYGQYKHIEGKDISLIPEGSSMTILISKTESSTKVPQMKQEQDNHPVESNVKPETEKKEDNPQYDPYHVPGAHYENWERCS